MISIIREAILPSYFLLSSTYHLAWLGLPVQVTLFELAATLGSKNVEKLHTGKIGSPHFLVTGFCLSTSFLNKNIQIAPGFQ